MTASVDLYWIPLGAGGHFVRWNGRIYEALAAYRHHREIDDLYHSALLVQLGNEHFIVEMTPAWGTRGANRGVAIEGPVMFRWLGRSNAYRYEVRCWRNGVIPDVDYAVASPQRLSEDPLRAQRIVDLVRSVPPLTWGRDELHAGEMWNSNSVVAWLLARSQHDVSHVRPPTHGRAPGWNAGLVAAGNTSLTVSAVDR